MRNLKKVLSLALALVMLLGMMVMGAGAAEIKDIDSVNTDNQEAVKVMNALTILVGDENGDFNPNGTLTRAAAAKIILAVAKGMNVVEKALKIDTSVMFDDMSDPDYKWAGGIADYCANLEIVKGTDPGKFSPAENVTAIQFATMLARVMDPANVEKYTGADWEVNTKVFATQCGLTEALSIANWEADMTREEAAQMAFNGLTNDPSGETEYIVTIDGVETNCGTDYELAKLMMVVNGGTIKAQKSTQNTLGKQNYGLTSDNSGEDAFGHPVKVWKQNDEVIYTDTTPAVAASIKIANKTEDTAKNIENKTLKNVAGFAAEWTYIVDGNDGAVKTGVDSKAAVAALCAENNVVEIYLNSDKKITKIIVVNTYAGKVTVTEAKGETKRKITVGGISMESEDFAKDDIVLYNKAYVKDSSPAKYTLANVELAPTVEGVIASFNADNKFKIDGKDYSVSTLPMAGTTVETVKDLLGVDATFYLNSVGKIIAAVATDDTVTSDDVLYVYNVAVTKGGKFEESNITAELQVVLPSGEVAVYTMPITDKNDSFKYSYKLGGVEQVVTASSASETDIRSALNLQYKVFTYTVKDGEVTLVAKPAAPTASTENGALTVDVSGKDIDNGTMVTTANSQNVILNSKTVYVLIKDAKTVKVVTGAAALEGTPITDANASVVAKKTGANNVAQVVFAKSTEFVPAVATDSDDYVYVDAKTKVTSKGENRPVYTYTATKADGTSIDLIGGANKDTGVYKYNSDGELVDVTGIYATQLGLVTDEIVQIGGNYYAREDENIVIIPKNTEVATGATVWAVIDDGKIVVMFVTAGANSANSASTSGTGAADNLYKITAKANSTFTLSKRIANASDSNKIEVVIPGLGTATLEDSYWEKDWRGFVAAGTDKGTYTLTVSNPDGTTKATETYTASEDNLQGVVIYISTAGYAAGTYTWKITSPASGSPVCASGTFTVTAPAE